MMPEQLVEKLEIKPVFFIIIIFYLLLIRKKEEYLHNKNISMFNLH